MKYQSFWVFLHNFCCSYFNNIKTVKKTTSVKNFHIRKPTEEKELMIAFKFFERKEKEKIDKKKKNAKQNIRHR